MNESEMREHEVPTPKTWGDLKEYVDALLSQQHDYGTAAYSVSLAAVAMFNFMASKMGITGFQASCADLDILRRTRDLKHGFALVDFGKALYPQYLSDDHWYSARRVLAENREQFADEARKLLANRTGHEHSDVVAHWKYLASRALPKASEENPQP